MMPVEATDQAASSVISRHSDSSRTQLGKDAFLKLLVTQLRNQDPLKPMENMEFVAQLSQFSSLEQLWNVNETLSRNGDLTKSVHNALMTNLIGKDIKVSEKVIYWTEDSQQELAYDLAQSGNVAVQVVGELGKVIRNIDVGREIEGEHSVLWDGKDNFGKPVAPGNYNFKVFLVDEQGRGTEVPTYLRGKVTGIRFVDGNPVLYIGRQAVDPSDIVAIYESSEN